MKIGRDNFGHVTRIDDSEGGLRLVMKTTEDGLGGKGTVKKRRVGCGQEWYDLCWFVRENVMEDCNEWGFRIRAVDS